MKQLCNLVLTLAAVAALCLTAANATPQMHSGAFDSFVTADKNTNQLTNPSSADFAAANGIVTIDGTGTGQFVTSGTIQVGKLTVTGLTTLATATVTSGTAAGLRVTGTETVATSVVTSGTVTTLTATTETAGTLTATTSAKVGATGTAITRLRFGTATLSGTSATLVVTDTNATASTRYFVSPASAFTVYPCVSAQSAGASFTITGGATDTTVVRWLGLEP